MVSQLPHTHPWHPVISGKQLASSSLFSDKMLHIQSLAALPDEYYQLFYQAPLEQLLAIYQVMDNRYSQQRLTAIARALKKRRSYHLPFGVKPEDIREQKDLWTYVVFVAALFYNLPDVTQYNIVYKTSNQTQEAVAWNPYLPTMVAEGFYRSSKRPDNTLHAAWEPSTLLLRLLPLDGISWLYSDSTAWNSVLALITTPDKDTPLGNLIISSHDQQSQQRPIGHELYTLINRAMTGKLDASDKLHQYLCLTHDGYAIAIPDVFQYYGTIKEQDSAAIEASFYALAKHRPSAYAVTFPNIGKKEAILIDSTDSV